MRRRSCARALPDWSRRRFRRLCRAALSGLLAEGRISPRKVQHAQAAARLTEVEMRSLATEVATDAFRGVTELTDRRAGPSLPAVDHRRRLRGDRRQYRRRAGLHHDGRAGARHDLLLARSSTWIRRRIAPRAAHRRFDRESRCAAKSGSPRLIAAKGAQTRSARPPSTSRPTSSSTTACPNRATVIEVSGLDRPGLLFDLTNAISKLNLNIGSAHIVTFGEKAVDVFYVTDLTGAKIVNPPRVRRRSSADCSRRSARERKAARARAERRAT